MDNMENVSLSDELFKLEWYYIDSVKKEPAGPLSIRDLDVLMRTNLIDTNTYVWKDGMEDWKKIFQIEELKDIANTTHTEIQESLIRSKIQASFSTVTNHKSENNSVENYYFGADGLWHVYNPISKLWTTQETKPIIRKKSYEFEVDDIKIQNIKEKSSDLIKKSFIDISDEIVVKSSTSIINKDKDSIEVENEFELHQVQNEKNQTSISPNNKIETKNKFIKKKRKFEDKAQNVALPEEDIKILEKRRKKTEKRNEKKKQQWYASKINSNVYVNYLPADITEKEIIEYFSRCGFIRKDPRTSECKVKIYKDKDTGKNKGDALISYLREESVQMAVDLLNESDIRPGYKIKVEKAKFEQKGNYQARESYKIDELQRFKIKTDIDRLLGWNEEDEEKGLKIVILKNMFEPSEFINDPELRKDIELDIIEESETNFGQIDKFLIFEEHPEGCVKIKFHTPSGAEKCIQTLNGRFYNGRNIEAAYWDGKTDYAKAQEDEVSVEKRIEEFGEWLEK